MEIKAYNKTQLLMLVESDTFKQMEHIPISTHRAISHCENPRLRENDPLLYIAFENGVMIGYLGAMPDKLKINGDNYRSAYLSSLWISPSHRGKGLASLLVQKMAPHYPLSLLTEYVEPTKPVYDRSGVYHKQPYVQEGIRIYFFFTLHEILINKWPTLKKVKFPLRIIDSLLNTFLKLLPSPKHTLPSTLRVEEVHSFSSEMMAFIQKNNTHEFLTQDAEKFNWILSYPWVIDSSEKDAILNKKYYFSSHAKNFTNTVLVGRNEQNQIQFILFFTQREGSVKLPYIYCNHDIQLASLAILNWLSKSKNVKTFTCFHPEISAQLFQLTFKAAFKNKILKKTLLSKKLIDKLPSTFYIQDGEGDSVFT